MDTQLPRAKAASKERRVFRLLEEKVELLDLRGKRRFAAGKVSISTDQSFKSGGKTYLVEVDSGNMAKLLVGQYVLINALRPTDEQFYFLVIHTYTGYELKRTLENLSFVNQKLYDGDGIPFGVVHISQLDQWDGGGITDFLRLCDPQAAVLESVAPAWASPRATLSRTKLRTS